MVWLVLAVVIIPLLAFLFSMAVRGGHALWEKLSVRRKCRAFALERER